jgi:phage FluMu protein gp41
MPRKKKTKPEEIVADPIENATTNGEEENVLANPDLASINMLCTNVALLNTILNLQARILAKINDQDLAQVNAEIDVLLKKHHKKAMTDLTESDKNA